MKIRYKLIASFFSLAAIVAIVGFVGLIASRQIAKSFEGGEQHFRSVVSAATELSNYVKSADSSLMLYLVMHDKVDKVNFFNNYLFLREKISLLENDVKTPETRMILDEIRFYTDELLPASKALIAAHDREMSTSGSFNTVNHKGLIRSFNDLTASVQNKGIELAHYVTDFLNRQEAITAATEISNLVKRAEGHLLLYLAIHDEADRNKFVSRHSSLHERISILDSRVKDPAAREILERIKSNVDMIMPVSNALIFRHDHDMKSLGMFQIEKRRDLIKMFSRSVSSVREDGLKLAKFNIRLESRKKETAVNQATYFQRIIIAIVSASIFIAFILGYILSNTISSPIEKLKKAATMIGSGKLDTPIDIRSEDEIGSLASNLKTMAENLQKTMVSKDYVDNIITSMMDSLVVVDLNGNIKSVNRALCAILHYNEEELIGYPVQKIFAEDHPFESILSDLMKKGYMHNTEKTYLTKESEKIPVLFSGSALYSEGHDIQGIVFVALNITDLKESEKQLRESEDKLRNLLAYLQSVREHERTEFAHEIHDELGQSLTALKMDLHWLGSKFKEHASIVAKTKSMSNIIDRTIKTVKKICIELRPGVLDDLGLTAAIEWQTQEFEKRSGITCDLFFDPEEIMLDRDRSTAVFRIFQETLTNIARHSNATAVSVRLKKTSTQLVMEVRDNGEGIREDEKIGSESFGLIGMRERALFLGGTFRINGVKGKGTTVMVSIPFGSKEKVG